MSGKMIVNISRRLRTGPLLPVAAGTLAGTVIGVAMESSGATGNLQCWVAHTLSGYERTNGDAERPKTRAELRFCNRGCKFDR